MSVPYPSIIDWIPWPQIRDKLIIHHAANPRVDDVICDIGNSYVLPVDLSLLIKCPQSVLGYVGVWDLVRAIAPEATGSPEPPSPEDMNWHDDNNANGFQSLTLPAKDANTLFSSRELAAQAFKLLGADKGAANFRLDPAFFGKHPEMYDNSSTDLMAFGVALRPDMHIANPICPPEGLKVSVVAQYQEMSKYLIDLALESRHITQTFHGVPGFSQQ